MARSSQYFSGSVTAPFGELTVVASDAGVRYVMFPDDAHPKPLANFEIICDPSHKLIATTLKQLQEYFDGVRKSFDIPLDLHGTDFQLTAWKTLGQIPFGQTITYGQQAIAIGRPKAVRAIGGANGRNPVVILLPCHRVIGADGSLTGFGGGIDVKKWLLAHEQKVVALC